MKKHLFLIWAALAASLLFVGCEKDSDGPKEPALVPDHALFVVNSGNLGSSNASLTIYDPATKTAQNEVFTAINGYKLGDTAQSMTIHDNTGWIVVNNSHIIFAIDLETMKEKGRITGINSPRYICFVSDTKAYVSQMYSNKISIINPKTYEITGTITCPNMDTTSGSSEQMLLHDGYLYVSCWSFQKDILKIDTATDQIVATLEVGTQPASLVLDCNNKLWTLCDGCYSMENPTLCRINPTTMTLEKEFTLAKGGDFFPRVHLNSTNDKLYWINNGTIYSMPINAETLPATPTIQRDDARFYSMTIDPLTNEIYAGDAIDSQQPGILYRYSNSGALLDSFYVGIIPENYCWN